MLKENPPQNGTQYSRRTGPTSWKSRYTIDHESGDLVECSGKYCRSCTAGCIGDSLALCCCPCALVNLFALAFVKVPWMVGRKCLKKILKKRKISKKIRSRNMEINQRSSQSKKSCSSSCEEADDQEIAEEEEDYGNLKKGRVEDGILKILRGGDYENEEGNLGSARFEAERVWLELYEDGHLGFGRVSFTG
ncbi:hypothetical protein JCGZ_09579 [Jatropha curcas]|uniref:Uncharacterized protein n=1 Tax=Jatropha curcas TaxID=180498 RepID=A0A067LKU8_JATCU|nr:uncharacterized protein LOC105642911 [Jatropha curcas]KDP45330.1 hypothetical protein JCGZ_09579 [Jatropha curcas]